MLADSAPNRFAVRSPVAAGRFYPADPQACREAAAELVRSAIRNESTPPKAAGRGWGGIVPHAGWICSGAIAGQTIGELAQMNSDAPPDLVVVFGAVHTPIGLERAALDAHEVWQTPSGPAASDVTDVKTLGRLSSRFVVDERFHRHEHAVEVELPLIQSAWPQAAVLPIEVPLIERAGEIGRETAQSVLAGGKRVVFLASSDLTHYGPAYGFMPAGTGTAALDWAKQNDRRLLSRIMAFDAGAIVPEVVAHANACGGGAIAAMLAACREAGASQARLLRHANSYKTLSAIGHEDSTNAVGYAAVVVS